MSNTKTGAFVRRSNADLCSHPDGHEVAVKDGHLKVYDREKRTVAIYAVGTWLDARVNR